MDSRMVKILDLSEHMGLRIAGRLQGISRIHPGYIGLRARYFVVTLLISGDDDWRMIASDFFGHTRTRNSPVLGGSARLCRSRRPGGQPRSAATLLACTPFQREVQIDPPADEGVGRVVQAASLKTDDNR